MHVSALAPPKKSSSEPRSNRGRMMSIAQEHVDRPAGANRLSRLRRNPSWKKRLAFMAGIYFTILSGCFLLAEIGFRLFWNPKYWIHTGRLIVGSGQTEAGKKWWPETDYSVESSEFQTEFGTNAAGYRARPGRAPR